MHKEDLKRVAPLWLKFSKAVRHDPDVRLYGSVFCQHLPLLIHPHICCDCFPFVNTLPPSPLLSSVTVL